MPLDPALYSAFFVVALAAILSPGPDTLLVIRATLGGGLRCGGAALFGVLIGLLGHLAAAVFGISLLVMAVPQALQAIAVIGALYLCWLGFRALRDALNKNVDVGTIGASAKRLRAGVVCRDALLTNLLNPKVIFLFIALMPGFVAPERGDVPLQLALLGVTIIFLNFLWQVSLVLLAVRARRWLERPMVQRGLAFASGLVFIAFAVLMVVEFILVPA